MKLKERILIAFLAGVVLLTVFVVLDVESNLAHSRRITPIHDRVHFNFHLRNLKKTANGSREGASQQQLVVDDDVQKQKLLLESERREIKPVDNSIVTPAPDPYTDLLAIAQKAEAMRRHDSRRRRKHSNPSIGDMLGLEFGSNATLWDRFHVRITKNEIYHTNDDVVGNLLKHVATAPITHISQKEGGTQLKLIIEFDDGGHALFKPQRFRRDQQTMKNHFYFTDYERHNAEIAAFHLDKLLGFHRAVPVIGRTVNITRDLYALAQGALLRTFFISPDNNLCFHGKCSYYCDTGHAICGNPDMLEGSFAIFLPGKDAAPRKTWRHPWRRSYNKRRKAQWELDEEYCDLVKEVQPYSEGRRLLDLMDMSIFDFLIGNMDRHHYESFKMFGNNSAPIHLDHGRSFGKPFHDEISILAPFYQCCLIRHSTLLTLLSFHNGSQSLGQRLKKSLMEDPLTPVLWEPHFAAVDRRHLLILQMIRECVQKAQNPFEVVINDFH